MRERLALVLVAVALLPLATAASSDQGSSAGYTLRPQQENHPNPAALAPGDWLVYSWQVLEPAGSQLYFSTHLHLGAQLVNISEENQTGVAGRFLADREGLYSVLWRNLQDHSITYRYSYHVERGSGGQDKSTPVPAALALVALGGAAVLRRRE